MRIGFWIAGVVFALAAPVRAQVVEWNLDRPYDVLNTVNLEPGTVDNGRLSGWSAWDPYVGFRVPDEGIDAAKLTWLTVRMYSSAEADLLDVYYESPDKRWCLGGKFPIRKGWATYRMDLVRNNWRETRSGDESKQWGGPSKRVRSFRLDPGNQEGRWIMIDSVKLHAAEPGLVEGVAEEPRGTATLRGLTVAKSVEAGRKLPVSAEFVATVPEGLTSGTAYVRLRRGAARRTSDAVIMRLAEQPVSFAGGTFKAAVELPISPYWYACTPAHAQALTVEAGCYELDGPAVSADLSLTNPRVGRAKPPVAQLRPLGGDAARRTSDAARPPDGLADAAIFLDGRPLPAMMYCVAGGLHIGYHREIAGAGIHLYSDWLGASRHSDMGHVEPGKYDYGEYDRYFAAILDADPQAYFLPHIGVTGPLWWQKAHPDELCRLEDGTAWPPSFASELWKEQMGGDLRKLIAYLRQAPYADRIIGVVFFSGYTAEWQMWGTWQESRCDYSAPALRAFRRFLKDRYQTDEKLRAAWNDPNATLAAAEMPKWAKRRPGGPQVLRDPDTERPAMDLYEFYNNIVADALLHFARIAREATQGQSLVGTYYAYLTAHGINQQDSGHLAAKRVFDSPDIDFLMSPPNYWYRKPGEACTFMSAADSFRLRGKLWLNESDNRTHLSDPAAGYGRAATMDETLGVFWREFAHVLAKRAAVSWLDMAGGWFSDPRILSDMGRSYDIMKESLSARRARARRARARRPFAPAQACEIGVFVDADSFYWMRPTAANAALVLHQVVLMPQAGAPWDFLLLDDIADARLPDYKLYVFLNAFHVSAARRDAIHRKLAKNNATALFVYAPGYFGADAAPLENMRALTGIRIAKDDAEGRPMILLDPDDPLGRGIAPDVGRAPDEPVGAQKLLVSPVFYADDADAARRTSDARVAGRLADSKRPGLVVKKMSGWTSIYSGAMTLPPALMRNIARSAGVHIWLESNDALYTDGQFVGVHAAADGEKFLNLPGLFKVWNARSGGLLAERMQTGAIKMQRAQTILLRLEPVP